MKRSSFQVLRNQITTGTKICLTDFNGSSPATLCRSANNWWERSPNSGNTNNFCNVNSNGNANNNNASNSNGVSFGLCNSNRSVVVTPLGEISTSCRGRACSRLSEPKHSFDVVSRTLLAWCEMYGIAFHGWYYYAVRTRTQE